MSDLIAMMKHNTTTTGKDDTVLEQTNYTLLRDNDQCHHKTSRSTSVFGDFTAQALSCWWTNWLPRCSRFLCKNCSFCCIAIFLVAPKARKMPRCLSLPKHDPGFFPAWPGEDCAAGQWPVWRRAGHRDYNCKQYLLVKSIETSNLKTFFGKHIQKDECPVSSVEHLLILKEAIAFYEIDLCIHSLPWFDVAILGCLLRNALVWTNTTTSGKRLMVSSWEATMDDRSGAVM